MIVYEKQCHSQKTANCVSIFNSPKCKHRFQKHNLHISYFAEKDTHVMLFFLNMYIAVVALVLAF